jgi:hypothetical protein
MRAAHPVLVTLLLFGLVFVSCGKKGGPFPPSKETVNRVTGLEGTWNGEDVLLTGRIEETAEVREGDGCRLYYAAYPVDRPPCEGCPVEYQGYESFGQEALTGDVFSFKMPGIRRGNIYFFEVRLIGPEGNPGPPSNRVQVEVPELAK